MFLQHKHLTREDFMCHQHNIHQVSKNPAHNTHPSHFPQFLLLLLEDYFGLDDKVAGLMDYLDFRPVGFYDLFLECFVAIDLKVTDFKFQDVGQIAGYLQALDAQVKAEDENPSIGLIICKDKNRTKVEYALKATNKPCWSNVLLI